MSVETHGDLIINKGSLLLPDASGTDGGALVWNETTKEITIGDVPGGGSSGGGGDGPPTGSVFQFAGSSAPNGYLLCDGSQVSRATYSDLFNVIGTTYGAGNGTTTFNLPDLRNRFVLGKGASRSLGATGGAETHTLTISEMPSHSHPFNNGIGWGAGSTGAGRGRTDLNSPANDWAQWIGNTGGGQPHNNMPPYLVMNYIIKT